MPSPSESFTVLLQRHRAGAAGAVEQMLPLVYEELRALAQKQIRSSQDAHTLQPTALVHEVYLRLVDQRIASVADRGHFRGLCARLMRQILVDHARGRNAARRGGGNVVRLTTGVEGADVDEAGEFDLLALDEALGALGALDQRKGKVVELRLFGGLTVDEVAAALQCSSRTVEADWFFARAWLRARLGGEE